MRNVTAARVLTGVGVLGFLLVATRCAAPDAASAPKVGTGPGLSSNATALRPELAQRAVANGLLPHGMASVNWMAEIHTAGMQDFMTHRAEIEKQNPVARCRSIEQIVRRQMPSVSRATGITDPGEQQRWINSGLKKIGCATSSTLSVWTAPLNLAAAQEDIVTGSYQRYTGQLEDAMLASSNPTDAANRMDAVLSSAVDLGTPDASVLAAIASLGASSASYWYSVDQAGGGGGGINPGPQEMSIFMMQMCGHWCHVGWADLIGAVGGAASVIYTSGGLAAIAWPAVAGGALVGGLFGSISYAM